MNQRCEISSNQLVYMTLYPGECSAFDSPEVYHNSTANLLDCAIKSNLVIKLNRVVVDGKDVSSNIIRQQISHPFNFIIPKVNVAMMQILRQLVCSILQWQKIIICSSSLCQSDPIRYELISYVNQ